MSNAAQALVQATSSSAATGPCGRSGAAAPAPSGSPGTSRTAWRWRSRSSPGRARRPPGPSARPRLPPAAPPACLRAYGFGRDSRHVYIAYEYVPGATFRETLRPASSTTPSRSRPARRSRGARARARARDRPPRRQAVERAARGGHRRRRRLLDFGLAHSGGRDPDRVGRRPGTLAYISPERLAGGAATAAADIWAVGVMLWEALAGRHPFWRSSLLETARAIEGARPGSRPCGPTCRSR